MPLCLQFVFVQSVIVSLCHFLILSETLALLITFEDLIFHMSIPTDKTFPSVPTF